MFNCDNEEQVFNIISNDGYALRLASFKLQKNKKMF